MEQRLEILESLRVLKSQLDLIAKLTKQVEAQETVIKDLNGRIPTEGMPKEPALDDSKSTACREQRELLIANWTKLPKIMGYVFIAAMVIVWLILRQTTDIEDVLIAGVLIFFMARQSGHVATAVMALLSGGWLVASQMFITSEDPLALLPFWIGYAAVAFQVVYHLVQVLRVFLSKKEEKKLQEQELQTLTEAQAQYKADCERILAENEAKYRPHIQKAEEKWKTLRDTCAQTQKKVEDNGLLHAQDKNSEEVECLIHSLETFRADSVKEALLQYDDMLYRKARDAQEENRWKLAQMTQQFEADRRARQEQERFQNEWRMRMDQQTQIRELERMRRAIESQGT